MPFDAISVIGGAHLTSASDRLLDMSSRAFLLAGVCRALVVGVDTTESVCAPSTPGSPETGDSPGLDDETRAFLPL